MPAQPLWLGAGLITRRSFKADVAMQLSLVSGGAYGNVCIGPNTLAQYGNVLLALAHIESHPWVQAVMAGLPAPATLASTGFITDKRDAAVQALARVTPPAPLRLVFA